MANEIKPVEQFTFYVQKEQIQDLGVVFVPRKKQRIQSPKVR